MSDTKQPDDKTLTLGGRKTLSLRRTVGADTAFQKRLSGGYHPTWIQVGVTASLSCARYLGEDR